MVFIKVLKTRQYYKRYQVKYRRRREFKTDFYARRKMVIQSKNKFASPRYRLVVRISNKQVVCQIVRSKIDGDYCVASAYSNELPRYGLKVGLKNYAATYATGLLLARRLMYTIDKDVAGRKRHAKSKDMTDFDDKFVGAEEADGEYINNGELEDDEEAERIANNQPKAFKAVLDIGLQRTTLGARVFAALKGAVDGGINVPHSENLFPGYEADQDEEEQEELAGRLNEYIHGQHVSEDMERLIEEDEDEYKKLFANYIAEGVEPDSMEDMYTAVHAAIREDPSPAEKKDFDFKAWGKEELFKMGKEDSKYSDTNGGARRRQFKLNKAQKDAKIDQKLAYGQYCYTKAEAEKEA